jgi:glycosyltransferase involved in cell wall biosynthesis
MLQGAQDNFIEKEHLASIIIPTYNRAGFIVQAIESCLRQTYKGIEVLVVDDNSQDGTRQTVESYKDPRVKYFFHDKNLGVEAARNTGLRNARGSYIALLDSDDEWAPEKVSRQIEVFKKNEGRIGLIFTNGHSDYLGRNVIPGKKESSIVYDPGKDKFFPLRLLITPPSSWMLSREAVEGTGDFDENIFNNYGDGDYFTRVAIKYPVYFLNEDLVIWHAPEEHLNVVSDNQIKNREYFFHKHAFLIKKDRKYLFDLYKVLGKDSLPINKIRSREYLLKALLMKPWDVSVASKFLRSFL